MTDDPRNWLPSNALNSELACSALNNTLSKWAKDWFSKSPQFKASAKHAPSAQHQPINQGSDAFTISPGSNRPGNGKTAPIKQLSDDTAKNQSASPEANLKARSQSQPIAKSVQPTWAKTPPKGSLICESENVSLVIPPPARTILMNAVLGGAKARARLNDADKKLLDALEEKLVSALLKQLGGDVQRPPQAALILPYQFDIEIDGKPLLTVSFASQPLTNLIKRNLGQSVRAEAQLTSSRLAAAASSQVEISAILGLGKVSVRELENIAPGDVVLLDRKIGDQVLVYAPATDTRLGLAEFRREGIKTALRF